MWSRSLRIPTRAAWVAAASLLWSSFAQAEAQALTRQRVADLVKVAPAAQVVRPKWASRELGGGCRRLSLENPVVSAWAACASTPTVVALQRRGDRFLAGRPRVASVALAGRREAKSRARRPRLTLEERKLLLGALLQHAAVLRDQRQVAIATERQTLAARLLAAAQRRRAAGQRARARRRAGGAAEEARRLGLSHSCRRSRGRRRCSSRMLGLSGHTPVTGELVPDGEPQALALSW